MISGSDAGQEASSRDVVGWRGLCSPAGVRGEGLLEAVNMSWDLGVEEAAL